MPPVAALLIGIAAVATRSATPLIVPGRQIGAVRLGANPQGLDKTLGLSSPNMGDRAMMKGWSVWTSRTASGAWRELDIGYIMVGPSMVQKIEQIRVASPFFKTKSGEGAGSALAAVKHAFPSIRRVRPHGMSGPQTIVLYDDEMGGISFEFPGDKPNSRCSAVLVHSKNHPALDEYIPFYVVDSHGKLGREFPFKP